MLQINNTIWIIYAAKQAFKILTTHSMHKLRYTCRFLCTGKMKQLVMRRQSNHHRRSNTLPQSISIEIAITARQRLILIKNANKPSHSGIRTAQQSQRSLERTHNPGRGGGGGDGRAALVSHGN